MPSAAASAGTSTSRRPGASALWWVAPEAIQRARASSPSPGVEPEHAVGAAHAGVARLDDLARAPRRAPTSRRWGRATAASLGPGAGRTRRSCRGPARPGSGRSPRASTRVGGLGPGRIALPARGDEHEPGRPLRRVALAVQRGAGQPTGEGQGDRRGLVAGAGERPAAIRLRGDGEARGQAHDARPPEPRPVTVDGAAHGLVLVERLAQGERDPRAVRGARARVARPACPGVRDQRLGRRRRHAPDPCLPVGQRQRHLAHTQARQRGRIRLDVQIARDRVAHPQEGGSAQGPADGHRAHHALQPRESGRVLVPGGHDLERRSLAGPARSRTSRTRRTSSGPWPRPGGGLRAAAGWTGRSR